MPIIFESLKMALRVEKNKDFVTIREERCFTRQWTPFLYTKLIVWFHFTMLSDI